MIVFSIFIMNNLPIILFAVVVLAIGIIVISTSHKKEGFRGGGGRGGFRGRFRGGGRRFNRGYGWYYPGWYYYNDDVRSCINNYIDGCGPTKQCYDRAINVCV